MNAWQAIYIVSGVGAIIALTAYLITDALAMRRTYMLGDPGRPVPPHWPVRWFATATILIVLWLTAAIVR